MLIKNKIEDSKYLVRIRKPGSLNDYEEEEVTLEQENCAQEIEVSLRVIVSEEQRFTLILRKSPNEKIKSIAEELGDILQLSKYRLSFFFKGEKVNLGDRLGDKEIGSKPES
mmetsp:Transcript_40781/g.39376  ORF Transcript_40781/g.39376 Transcript_40781/m.39376 type:complete len:112 (+) Transcript_40781:240-575(+)